MVEKGKITRRKFLEEAGRVVVGATIIGGIGEFDGSRRGASEALLRIFNPGEEMASVEEFSPKAPERVLPLLGSSGVDESNFEWGRIEVTKRNKVVSRDGRKILFNGENFFPNMELNIESATLSPDGRFLRINYKPQPRHYYTVSTVGGEVTVETMLPRQLNREERERILIVERPRDKEAKKEQIRYLDFNSEECVVFLAGERVIVLRREWDPEGHGTKIEIEIWEEGEEGLFLRSTINPSLVDYSRQEDRLIGSIVGEEEAKVREKGIEGRWEESYSEIKIDEKAVATPDGRYVACPAYEERKVNGEKVCLRSVVVFGLDSDNDDSFRRITPYDFPGGSPDDTKRLSVVGSYNGNILVGREIRREKDSRGLPPLVEVGVWGVDDGKLATIECPKGAKELGQTEHGLEVTVGGRVYRFPNESIDYVKAGIIPPEETIKHWRQV